MFHQVPFMHSLVFVIAVLMKNFGFNPIIACLGGLLVGALAGLANGFIVNTFDIPAFIATLGTQYIFRGVVNVVSQGSAYTGFPESFSKLGGAGATGNSMEHLYSSGSSTDCSVAFKIQYIWTFAPGSWGQSRNGEGLWNQCKKKSDIKHLFCQEFCVLVQEFYLQRDWLQHSRRRQQDGK